MVFKVMRRESEEAQRDTLVHEEGFPKNMTPGMVNQEAAMTDKAATAEWGGEWGVR